MNLDLQQEQVDNNADGNISNVAMRKPIFEIPLSIKPLIAGAAAGAASTTVTCPLEVVKTRFQSSIYNGAKGAEASPLTAVYISLRNLWKMEGTSGMFRGLSASLIGIIPARSLHFSVYEESKRRLIAYNGGQEGSMVHVGSAVAASWTVATITNPLWILRTDGVRGLYQGLSASYLGSAESVIQWVLYEKGRSWIRKNSEGALNQGFLTFGLGAGVKLIACICTYPHEVLRTRLREGTGRYKSIIQASKLMLKEEGFSSFYRGLAAHLVRAVPHAAVLYLTYESVMKLLS